MQVLFYEYYSLCFKNLISIQFLEYRLKCNRNIPSDYKKEYAGHDFG